MISTKPCTPWYLTDTPWYLTDTPWYLTDTEWEADLCVVGEVL